MITTEDYVSFETAKLLKEKGFDEVTYRAYFETIREHELSFDVGRNNSQWEKINKENGIFNCSAPTLQTAMKWLRKEHNQIIIPDVRVEDPISGIINCYVVGIWYIPKNNGGALCFISPTPENGYSTYEEACEAGIKYCLENLI